MILAALLLAAAPLQDKPDKTVTQTNAERVKADAEAGYANAPVAEQATTHRAQVTVNGRALPYTATAGTLTLRDLEGKPTASMFYVAYTLDGTKPGTKRPITFF